MVACIPEAFCTQHLNGYFVENHLNIIQPNHNALPIDLYYLLTIISSDVIEFFFRSMNGNTQVSATELNLMPIPRNGVEHQIAQIARELHDTHSDKEKKLLRQLLNNQVANAYGLTYDELVLIQESLGRNHVV